MEPPPGLAKITFSAGAHGLRWKPGTTLVDHVSNQALLLGVRPGWSVGMVNKTPITESNQLWWELLTSKRSGLRYEVWFTKDEASIREDQDKAVARAAAAQEAKKKREEELQKQQEIRRRAEQEARRKKEFAQRKQEVTEQITWVNDAVNLLKTKTCAKVVTSGKCGADNISFHTLSQAVASLLKKHSVLEKDVSCCLTEGNLELRVSVHGDAAALEVCEDIQRGIAQGEVKSVMEAMGLNPSQMHTQVSWPLSRIKAAIDLRFRQDGKPKYHKLDEAALSTLIPPVLESFKLYSKIWQDNYVLDLEKLPSKRPDVFRQDAGDIEELMEDAEAVQKAMKMFLVGFEEQTDAKAEAWKNTPFNDRNTVPLSAECRTWHSSSSHRFPDGDFFDPGIKNVVDVEKKAKQMLAPPFVLADTRQLPVKKLKDVARMSIVFENAKWLYNVASIILKELPIAWCKNHFAAPSCLGYRDVNLGLKFDGRGQRMHTGELQLQLKAFYELKQGRGHKLYEDIRKVLQDASVEKDDVDALETLILDEMGITDGQSNRQLSNLVEDAKQDVHDVFGGEPVSPEIDANLVALTKELAEAYSPVAVKPKASEDDDYYWRAADQLLRDPNLLKKMVDYDKDNIPAAIIAKLTPLLEEAEFEPDKIKKKNYASGCICKWVRAMVIYDRAMKDGVRQKQNQLREAREEISAIAEAYEAPSEIRSTAESAYLDIVGALSKISKADVGEIRQMQRPPNGVKLVAKALCYMFE